LATKTKSEEYEDLVTLENNYINNNISGSNRNDNKKEKLRKEW